MTGIIETGVSFATGPGGERWHKHSIGLSFEQVAAHLEGPALLKWGVLSVVRKVFVVRAVEEVALCKFRSTRHDPDYREAELKAWLDVIERMLGTEGIDNLGVVVSGPPEAVS